MRCIAPLTAREFDERGTFVTRSFLEGVDVAVPGGTVHLPLGGAPREGALCPRNRSSDVLVLDLVEVGSGRHIGRDETVQIFIVDRGRPGGFGTDGRDVEGLERRPALVGHLARHRW